MVQSVTVTVKGAAARPSHHERVGVGQQGDRKTLLAQSQQGVKVALKLFGGIASPSVLQFFQREALAYNTAQLITVLLGSERALFQCAKDAFLGIIIQILFDMGYPYFLKPPDGNHFVKTENHATQVKDHVHLVVIILVHNGFIDEN